MEIEHTPERFKVEGREFPTRAEAEAFVARGSRVAEWLVSMPPSDDSKQLAARKRKATIVMEFLEWEARQPQGNLAAVG